MAYARWWSVNSIRSRKIRALHKEYVGCGHVSEDFVKVGDRGQTFALVAGFESCLAAQGLRFRFDQPVAGGGL